MSQDALFQLGMVSGALDSSQEEDHFRRFARQARVTERCAAGRPADRTATMPALLHPMQDQVCSSRTPA